MDCCQCQGIEAEFNRKTAARQLRRYRENGLAKTTVMLTDALTREGVDGMTLLDIGGGIGAIQHELLAAGAKAATNVEASTAYIEAAREEAGRRGQADRVAYHPGDFVDLAPGIGPADIVTLDRVICCYHDMGELVGASSARAQRLYGLVYPRDTWWTRLGITLLNLVLWVQRSPFRTFIHATQEVDAVVRGNGLERRFYEKTLVWQVVVYARSV
jgi:2-polyprenyl-3-methyl-5-hydroxy-6-metoxy-1,4-benzoquinol methylase